jgi:hypothetical protein
MRVNVYKVWQVIIHMNNKTTKTSIFDSLLFWILRHFSEIASNEKSTKNVEPTHKFNIFSSANFWLHLMILFPDIDTEKLITTEAQQVEKFILYQHNFNVVVITSACSIYLERLVNHFRTFLTSNRFRLWVPDHT